MSVEHDLMTDEVLALVSSCDFAGQCGFKVEHWGVSFMSLHDYCDQYIASMPWKALGRYLRDIRKQQSVGRGWIISGPTGTGKTAVLALIAEAVGQTFGTWHEPLSESQRMGYEQKRPRCLKIGAVELADFLMERKHEDNWATRYLLFRSVTHLMIDDLGSEYLDGFGMNGLYRLIDERYTRNLCTHLTLNMTLERLPETSPNAQRIASRLNQCSFYLELAGPDRRMPLSVSALDGVEF